VAEVGQFVPPAADGAAGQGQLRSQIRCGSQLRVRTRSTGRVQIIRGFAENKRVLQMPSFHATKSIGVFSDYSGDKGVASTYSFLGFDSRCASDPRASNR
jgi:hypothetical protein